METRGKLNVGYFIKSMGYDMISHWFNTCVTSLASVEQFLICRGVNEISQEECPCEAFWERIFLNLVIFFFGFFYLKFRLVSMYL